MCVDPKVETFLRPENDIFLHESIHINVDVLSTIQTSLCCWSCMNPFVSKYTRDGLAPFLTRHISDMPFRLSHWKPTQTAHCFIYPPPFFHFAMECLMWGVKKCGGVEHCDRATLWYALSPNLILAALKIVCIPRRTDRPLFPESLCCPVLCVPITHQRSHEKFTGQHLVWDREKGARVSITLPPMTAWPWLH